MAVTHADLAPSPKGSDLGSKTGAFLMVLSILLGLFCFILSLVAEAARSEATWTATSDGEKGTTVSQCTYTGNGKLPLLSASAAFVALAMAMLLQHTYLLLAVSKSDSLLEITWDTDSSFSKSFTWQAGFFFVSTWMSFAVGEILLLIGLSVESGHLNNWDAPHPSCLVIRPGLFTSGGVLGLVTVFFASGLYVTALRAERHVQIRENTRRGILEVSIMYASPPRSPDRIAIRAAPSEAPLFRQDHNLHTLYDYLTMFDKQSRLV